MLLSSDIGTERVDISVAMRMIVNINKFKNDNELCSDFTVVYSHLGIFHLASLTSYFNFMRDKFT